ncbi:SRPBCC family protein [Thiococcus pfennigii]|uniref:SRPBCC family protein n=1 Tax=Thiococcus pfennigii TaxID=1057 RepID=UPI0019083B6D|nr:SRPBCC family protein [Thiococcus pfennigii]MBK1732950.1 polyketide cyclase [Thiococcus pfennigii]
MVKAQASTLIRRPPAPVFAFVADNFHRNYPRWSPEVKQFQPLSDGPIRTGWMARQVRVDVGRRSEATFRVSGYEPGRCLSFEGISRPFRVDYRFEPVHHHTRITFTFELPRLELVWRPFERLIRSTVQDSAERLVQSVKQLAEAELPPADPPPR